MAGLLGWNAVLNELFLHGTRIDMPVPAFELVADHTDTHNQS